MRCGAKCFIVELEENGIVKQLPINARTPAGARKVIREQLKNPYTIFKIKQK